MQYIELICERKSFKNLTNFVIGPFFLSTSQRFKLTTPGLQQLQFPQKKTFAKKYENFLS